MQTETITPPAKLDLTAGFIFVSDITDYAEEIEGELIDAAAAAGIDWNPDRDGLVALGDAIGADDLIAEAETVRELLDDLRGAGGDYQWRGDWYPDLLIREDQFEGHVDEQLEDCEVLPRNPPPYLRVTVDYDALREDYAELEIGGRTYLYRR